MLTQKKIKLIAVLIAALLLLTVEESIARDVDIVFFGKAIDQYYKPIADANVYVEISQAKDEATKTLIIKTDGRGLFKVKGKGHTLIIRNMVKKGYEFLFFKNLDVDFAYSSTYPQAVFIPDSKAPILFHMQKNKNEPAYLIHQSSLERNFPPGASPDYSINLGGTWVDESGRLQVDTRHVDLTVRCDFSEERNQFGLSIISMDSNSGIFAGDELLDEAPKYGYMPKIVLWIDAPERLQSRKKYIYAQARGGQMYSRVELNMTVRPSNLLVSMEIWTNPEASTNLRFDKEYQAYASNVRYEVREKQYQNYMRAKKVQQDLRYVSRNSKQTSSSSNVRPAVQKGSNQKSAGDIYYKVYR
jgi:hypothetical protein